MKKWNIMMSMLALALAGSLLCSCGRSAAVTEKAETAEGTEIDAETETAAGTETDAETETAAGTETVAETETVSETETEGKTDTDTEKETENRPLSPSPEEALLLPAETLIEPQADTDAYFVIRTIEEGD